MRRATDYAIEASGLERALERERIASESLRHELYEAEGRIACLEGDLSVALAENRRLREGKPMIEEPERRTPAQEALR